MVPLLSPTMETEMLKESWTMPKIKFNNFLDIEEGNQNFSVWEENFQDLSGWCMDQFPQQCDFPTGEAINCKMTDMTYENEVSTVEGVNEGFTIVYDEKRNSDEDILHIADLSNLQSVVKYEKLEPSCTLANKPDVWLNLNTAKARDTTINFDTTLCTPDRHNNNNNNNNLKVQLPIQQVTQEKIMDPLEPNNVLTTFTAYEPESFDLLSYLCDDEVALPSASTATASQKVITLEQKNEQVTMPLSIENEERKLKRRNEQRESRIPSSSYSPSSSSSSSIYVEKPRNKAKKYKKQKNCPKVEKDFYKEKRRGPKRKLESDSDDNDFSDGNYRESREKNNEASRKSRMNKKAKEEEMLQRATQLEKDNKILKMKVEELEKLVTSMRVALLQSALKRER